MTLQFNIFAKTLIQFFSYFDGKEVQKEQQFKASLLNKIINLCE